MGNVDYGATLQFLTNNFSEKYESEYFPGIESGLTINGTLAQDCTQTSIPDSSLDLITPNQVLEYVPNFRAALSGSLEF
jgi:hypothetical protein